MSDQVTVTLTREQWERVEMWGRIWCDNFSLSWERESDVLIARAICEQAGLDEVFRCE